MLNKIRSIKGYKESWIFANSAMERFLTQASSPVTLDLLDHIWTLKVDNIWSWYYLNGKWTPSAARTGLDIERCQNQVPQLAVPVSTWSWASPNSPPTLWGQKVIWTSLATFCCIVSKITVSFPERPLIKFKARQAENTSGQKLVVQRWIELNHSAT